MGEDKVVGAFIGNVGRAINLLDALKVHFENHFDEAPEGLHWGHVGSAGKAVEDLEALCEFLNLKV